MQFDLQLGFNLAQPYFDQTTLATYNDQLKSVTVEAIVVGEPDTRDAYTNLRVEADQLGIADQPTRTVKGLVLIQAPPFTDFRYGGRIRAEGKLRRRPTRATLTTGSTLPGRMSIRSCRAHA